MSLHLLVKLAMLIAYVPLKLLEKETPEYMQGCFCQIFTGGSEFRLAMTDRATIAGMGVAKLLN